MFWSDEDEGFIALAPDLPGCSAFGESKAEAIAELRSAICAWIEAAKNAGNSVPLPASGRTDSHFSGRFVLRTPRSLHADLVKSAEKEGVSLNQYVCHLLSTAQSARLPGKPLPPTVKDFEIQTARKLQGRR